MSRVAEQMENHPASQVDNPEHIAKISKEIIYLEEQVWARPRSRQALAARTFSLGTGVVLCYIYFFGFICDWFVCFLFF